MNEELYIQFKEEYKEIIRINTLLIKNASYIRQLQVWGDMGIHEKSILKAIDERDALRIELNYSLKGLNYDDWVILNKRLTYLNSRLKATITSKKNIENKLSALDLTFLKNNL